MAVCLTFPSCLTSSPLAWPPVLVDGQARGDCVCGHNGHMPNPKHYPPTPMCTWQNIFLNSLSELLNCFYWRNQMSGCTLCQSTHIIMTKMAQFSIECCRDDELLQTKTWKHVSDPEVNGFMLKCLK